MSHTSLAVTRKRFSSSVSQACSENIERLQQAPREVAEFVFARQFVCLLFLVQRGPKPERGSLLPTKLLMGIDARAYYSGGCISDTP